MLEISAGLPATRLMTPGGSPAASSSFEDVVGAQHRTRCGLPDDRVAHQRRCRGKVAGDRGEVEWRDRVDETLERPVLHAVPHGVAADRLLLVELLRVVRIESPEVDELRRRIDLCLNRGLRLTQHRCCVQRGAPRRRQEFCRSQKHGRTILQRPAAPLTSRRERRVDGLLDVRRLREMPIGQDMPMLVWHHRRLDPARANVAAADHERNVDSLGGHRGSRVLSSVRSGECGR